MKSFEYLSMQQIEILLKYYYLKDYTRVAAEEHTTPGKVKRLKENALRTLRLSYSRSYIKGLRFDGQNALNQMAERAGIEAWALSLFFETYIAEGMASANRKYWARIKHHASVPSPAELLDFLYDKYEIEIEGFI